MVGRRFRIHVAPRLLVAAAALAACALAACGRIGVELQPLDGGQPPWIGDDATTAPDGTSAERDGSAEDGAAPDGGSEPTCPTACENPHGTATCETGSCVVSCENGYSDCDGNPTNGCEANVADELLTCGGCMLACTNEHGAALCADGLCTPTCAPGFDDCDENRQNGCERDLNTAASCGSCDVACANAHGSTVCTAGVCVPSCEAGYADCDGDPANGCETNTDADPTHCGSCTTACGTNGQICVDGACAASPCAAGRAECDGDLGVTCETDTTSSLQNCGFCDNVCSTANGTPQCVSSSCRVASCNSGFGNCDNNVANGCEAAFASSAAHCGACGNACSNAHGTTSCAASVCAPSCATGWGDCDSSRPNGCETALDTVSNCGACGRVCPANGGTPVCNAGTCGTICNLTGTFALKITAQTSWPNDQYIGSGNAPHRFWLKLQGTHNGTSVSETLTECGRIVPDFSSNVVNETFNFNIPNTVFDRSPGILPSSTATVTLSSSSPGATLSLPSTAFLMGTTLSNPVTASWPTAASGLTQVDMDGDGKPGLTILYLSGNGYTQPRVGGTLFSARAERPYIASRLVFSLNGTLNSCTQSSGSATVSRIDTRIFGCKIAGNSRDCNGSEANFLDQNCVNYQIGTATYSLVKVADGASCAAVRAAIP